MKKCDNAALRTIRLSEIESLKKGGYVPLEGGDAAKANSDYFMVMVRECPPQKEGMRPRRDVVVLCPSFLRGPLSVSDDGGIGY